jgi:hypothetical protein
MSRPRRESGRRGKLECLVGVLDCLQRRAGGATGEAQATTSFGQAMQGSFPCVIDSTKGVSGSARARGERGVQHGCQGHLKSPKFVVHRVGICECRRGIPWRLVDVLGEKNRGEREGSRGYLRRAMAS